MSWTVCFNFLFSLTSLSSSPMQKFKKLLNLELTNSMTPLLINLNSLKVINLWNYFYVITENDD